MGDYITTRSFQFSADIVSLSGNGRAFKRCRVVIDAREDLPRALYWKELTHLGWPLDPEIIPALRSGASLSEMGLYSRERGLP